MSILLDGTVQLAAFTPVSPGADAALKGHFHRPVDEFEAFRLARQGKPFHIPDTEEIPHAPIKETRGCMASAACSTYTHCLKTERDESII